MGGCAAGGSLSRSLASEPEAMPQLRVGVLTDCHYADKEAAGTRHYRDSLKKVDEAVSAFNDAGAAVAVELGDYIDAAPDAETEVRYLEAIEKSYARFDGDRHYVLGNHCVATLTKKEFLANTGMRRNYYSFDKAGVHVVVLDACYREDGVEYGRNNFDWTDTNLPTDQLDWLKSDLRRNDAPTVVCVHQRLDLDRDDEAGRYYAVKNAPAARRLFEESGNVKLVLQGHSHENSHREIAGIHYCVMRAVVEGEGLERSGYATLDLMPDLSMRIIGFRKQHRYRFG